MIKKLIATSILSLTVSGLVNANECKSELFDNFKRLEKTEHQRLKNKPTLELAARMEDFEILCPMQIELDFDGDRKRDWVGFVDKNGQIMLAGYFSFGGKSKFVEIWEYPEFPTDHFLSFITLKEFKLLAKNPEKLSRTLRYALVINRIGQESQVLQWNGETMQQMGSYEGSF